MNKQTIIQGLGRAVDLAGYLLIIALYLRYGWQYGLIGLAGYAIIISAYRLFGNKERRENYKMMVDYIFARIWGDYPDNLTGKDLKSRKVKLVWKKKKKQTDKTEA